MTLFKRKNKERAYDDSDKAFIISVLDALAPTHGDSVLEISKHDTLSAPFLSDRYGAYVHRISSANEFSGGEYDLSLIIDVCDDFENAFFTAINNAVKTAVIFVEETPDNDVIDVLLRAHPETRVESGNYFLYIFENTNDDLQR